MIDEKDALLRDDPALVIDRHNAIIRARSSIGTQSSAPQAQPLRWQPAEPLPRDFLAPTNVSLMTTTILPPPPAVSPLGFELYREMADSELEERILAAKERLGDSLLILGHHYQQDEVIRFADLRGDSFKLSKLAAENNDCRSIVFCGVHFMAETADILSREEVEVYLPDLAAGCSMADMADLDSVEAAWRDLADVIDVDDLMPVTYVNSSADLKAFCGRHGGIVCTSSNARAVLDWAFARRRRVLVLPRPASGPEHSPTNGNRSRGDDGLGSPRTVRWQHGRTDPFQSGHSLERATARSTRCSSPTTLSNFGAGFPIARSSFIPNV